MAASPWITLPPTADDAGVTYPGDHAKVWVRLRCWTRKPFRAIWHNSGTPPSGQFAAVADADWNEIAKFQVPWWELDAWHAAT